MYDPTSDSSLLVVMLLVIASAAVFWYHAIRKRIWRLSKQEMEDVFLLLRAVSLRCPVCDSTEMRQPTRHRLSTGCRRCGANFGIDDVRISLRGPKLPAQLRSSK